MTKITIANNGPIRIEGEFAILDPAGASSVWRAAR